MVHEIADTDHRTLRFHMPGKDAKEALMREMFYTRSGAKKET
jgi:hypothetical protein